MFLSKSERCAQDHNERVEISVTPNVDIGQGEFDIHGSY